jgi:hypothetical protein
MNKYNQCEYKYSYSVICNYCDDGHCIHNNGHNSDLEDVLDTLCHNHISIPNEETTKAIFKKSLKLIKELKLKLLTKEI